MDPDGRPTADGARLDDNVVRLPRDWLGPRDEFTPFGPSANGQSADSAPTADAFWGEDSSSLQSAVEAPLGAPTKFRVPHAKPIAFLMAVLTALATVAVLGSTGHTTATPQRASSTSSDDWYLAMGARTLRAHDATVRHVGAAAVGGPRAKRHTTVAARHAASHPTHRSTVVIVQVHYVTAPAEPSSAGTSAASPTPPAEQVSQASSASSSPAAGSESQPAVGANGALGPGTSPDG